MQRHLPMTLAVSLLLACSAEPPSAPTEATLPSERATHAVDEAHETLHPNGDPVPLDRRGSVDLTPERVTAEIGVRKRQRMNLDQLDRAIVDATGFQWTDGADGPSMFARLESTLGKPNFIENTLEDLSPSLLFHKFLDDGARYVCTALMTAESERSADERIFLTDVDPEAPLDDAEGVNATLANALLRFHGRHVAPDAAELDVWRWLLENTPASEGEPLLAWTNVCTGLITHPDFYAY